jgi:hypothetical protein
MNIILVIVFEAINRRSGRLKSQTKTGSKKYSVDFQQLTQVRQNIFRRRRHF